MNNHFESGADGNRRRIGQSGEQGGQLVAASYPGVPAVANGMPIQLDSSAAGLTLSDLWRIIVAWRWLILAVAGVVLAGAVAITVLTPKAYRATATIEIETRKSEIIDDKETATQAMSDDSELLTQLGVLESWVLAEKVVRALNLAGASGDTPVEETVTDVRKSLTVDPVEDSRLVRISYESTEPEMAARVANAFASTFITSSLERRYDATAFARSFLQKRLDDARSKLEESERRLVQYARAQGIINVGSSEGEEGGSAGTSLTASSLVSLNDALSEAQRNRIAAEQRYRQGAASDVSEMLNNPVISQLTNTRAQLQAEYEEKLKVFRPEFPQMQQLKARIDQVNRDIARETSRVRNSLRSDYAAAANAERALQGRVNQLKSSVMDLSDRSIQYGILKREVDTNRTLYDGLLQRFKELGASSGVGASPVSIVDPARVPRLPYKPNLFFNLGLGLLLGIVLGLLAAFIAEFMNDKIAVPEDIEGKLHLPVLGTVPRAPKGGVMKDLIADDTSSVGEAYFSVLTALQFSTPLGVPRSLLVTSSGPAEGKSSSAFAVARAFARMGSRVLLIDADLRRPSLSSASPNMAGLSNLLTGAKSIEETIYSTNVDKLWLMPSGPVPTNPAQLLASERLPSLLANLVDEFDMVVIDAPPVMGLADAPILSSLAEGTLVVFESGRTRRHTARAAVNRLNASGAQVIGGLLTKFDLRSYGYGYGYGYEKYGYRHGEDKVPDGLVDLLPAK